VPYKVAASLPVQAHLLVLGLDELVGRRASSGKENVERRDLLAPLGVLHLRLVLGRGEGSEEVRGRSGEEVLLGLSFLLLVELLHD